MSDPHPLAKRHVDYVQIVRLRTSSPKPGVPSLQTFAEEQLRATLSEPEPDGYTRISKQQAEELVSVIDDYAVRFGPLLANDRMLIAQLRDLLSTWE